jgi:polyhydroxybutyrate depolymerase
MPRFLALLLAVVAGFFSPFGIGTARAACLAPSYQGPGGDPGAGSFADEAIQVGSPAVARTFQLVVPASYDPTSLGAGAPLVLDLHGLTSNGKQQALLSSFSSLAASEGFIVANPEGLGNSWNAGMGFSCCGSSGTNNVDDVGFLKALVKHVAQKWCIDEARVFASGMSNGGLMRFLPALFLQLLCLSGLTLTTLAPPDPNS